VSAPELHALVMAGGRGVRFWPRSRRNAPKQCLDPGTGRTLLQATIDRLAPLIPEERIVVVTSKEVETAVRADLGDWNGTLLVEPMGRNTSACVGWGSMEIAKRAGQDPCAIAVLPSDHLISDEDLFRRTLADCGAAALATNALVTVGIEPTRPETGFGYLGLGGQMGTWGESGFLRVDRFIEKPDAEAAKALLEAGGHLWNAGMFVFTPDAIRDAFRDHLPESWALLERIRHNGDLLDSLYPQLEAISLDHGVMERATHVMTTVGGFGWSDLGSWGALGEVLPDCEGGKGRARRVVAVDSSGCVVDAPGKVVALVGVKDLVVVVTDDAILVGRAYQPDPIRQVVDRLEATHEDDVL
jgi:mannose-1-phosphate guanylyltransferase